MFPLLSKERIEAYKKTATTRKTVPKDELETELSFLQYLLEEKKKLISCFQIEFPEVSKDTKKQYFAYELQRLKEKVEAYEEEDSMNCFIIIIDTIFKANETYLTLMASFLEEILKTKGKKSFGEYHHLMLLANSSTIDRTGINFVHTDKHIIVDAENDKYYMFTYAGDGKPILLYSKRDVRPLTEGEQEKYEIHHENWK